MADDVHVYPVADKYEHELNGMDCLCDPIIEVNGANLLIIHNAFDFREIAEELNERINNV